jgi:hypothetical protein
MKSILLFSTLILAINSYGQNSYTLNTNNASAIINSDGRLFYNTLTSSSGYGMVSDSGAMGIYFSVFLIGGLDDNDSLHTCITFYNNNDLKSGPISQNQSYTDPNYLNKYDQKIWTVTADEIAYHSTHYYYANYTMPNSILNWPANGDAQYGVASNLAQFVDYNNNGIYDPQNGDYPLILGDKIAYLILNDDPALTTTNSFRFEYHLMFYQYASSDSYINNTTFLHLTIFNRSGANYHDLRVAQFTDFDIGSPTDDYIGCDSTRQLIFGYNGSSIDYGMYAVGFGPKPPAFGIKQLNQPMDVAMYYNYQSANNSEQFWERMNGFWNESDTSHITYGGVGIGGDTISNYTFSGNPYTQTGWSEVSESNPLGDRRMLMSTDGGILNNGESVCIDYAYIYARNGADNLANVNALYGVADSIQSFYNDISDFYCPDGNILLDVNKIEPTTNQLEIYPNPNNGNFTVNFNGQYNLKIYEMNGKLIKSINNLNNNSQLSLNLIKGMYIVQVEQNQKLFYKKIVIE